MLAGQQAARAAIMPGLGTRVEAAVRRNSHLARRLWWVVLLVGSIAIAVLAELKAQPAPGKDVEVLAADQSLGEAMRTGNRSIARRFLSLQFTYIDENGKLHERKNFLSDLKNVAAAPAAGSTARIYGSVAMVTGRRKSATGNEVFFLDIWAQQKRAWRLLTMQDVLLAADERSAPPEALEPPGSVSKLDQCKNPCQTIPYRVRSPAEQDIVNSFQAIEQATVAHDSDAWAKHIADEFVHYRSGYSPISKSGRIEIIQGQKERNVPAFLTAIQSMRLWIYGDGAAMISNNGLPEDSEPLLRIARVWVRRNGAWQMAISAQTVVK
jgi:hypothetical protein